MKEQNEVDEGMWIVGTDGSDVDDVARCRSIADV